MKYSIVYPSYCLFESSRILYENINEKEKYINKSRIVTKQTLSTTIDNILKDQDLTLERNEFNKALFRPEINEFNRNSFIKPLVMTSTRKELSKTDVISLLDNSLVEVEKLIMIINYAEDFKPQKTKKREKAISVSDKETVELIRNSTSSIIRFPQQKKDSRNNFKGFSIEDALDRFGNEDDCDNTYVDEKTLKELKFIAKIKRSGDKIIERLRIRKHEKLSLIKILEKSSNDNKLEYDCSKFYINSESTFKKASKIALFKKKNPSIFPNPSLKSSTDASGRIIISQDESKKYKNSLYNIKQSLTLSRNSPSKNAMNALFPYPSNLKVSLYQNSTKKENKNKITSLEIKSDINKPVNIVTSTDFSNLLTTVNLLKPNKTPILNKEKLNLCTNKTIKLNEKKSDNLKKLSRNVLGNNFTSLDYKSQKIQLFNKNMFSSKSFKPKERAISHNSKKK